MVMCRKFLLCEHRRPVTLAYCDYFKHSKIILNIPKRVYLNRKIFIEEIIIKHDELSY